MAVVGAGVVGSYAAHVTAKKDLKTLLIEEHRVVGTPPHCAGLLYHKAREEFNISKDSILNEIKGAHLYSPNGMTLSLQRNHADSYVVDRQMLDLKLAERACDSGATLLNDTKCYDLVKDREGWLVKLSKKKSKTECKAQMIIDAEGWKPSLPEKLGIKRKLQYLKGAQFEMSNINFQSEDHVELFFGKHYFPGFFAWIIPMSGNRAKIGLCVNKSSASPFWYLEHALKKHPLLYEKTRNAKIEKRYGGIIPIHGPIERTYLTNFLVVGDSAGHVKSTTGGGIYFGLKASAIAGETVIKSFESNNVATFDFKIYETLWKQSFGKEIYITSKVRKIADRLSDKDIDYLFDIISKNDEITHMIKKYGDTAFQSELFIPLVYKLGNLLKPKMLKILTRNIPELIKLIRKI